MSEPAFTHFDQEQELNRRQIDHLTYELIAHKVTRMAGDMDKMVAAVKVIETTLVEQAKTESLARERLLAELLAKSFPDGDPEGHRRYHEASIKKAEASAKMWADIQVSTAKWGIAGALGWLVVLLWQAFLQGPAK